jgi:hypothetical protein
MEHNKENIEPVNQTYQDDEISLRELIEKVKVLFTYFIGYKWLIVSAWLLGGGIGFGYAHFFNLEEYESNLTFAIEEKSGGGSLMGLASQFGVDLGGGGGALSTSDNLILLFKSNKIIQGALLRPLTEVKEGNLYNHYLAIHYEKDLNEKKISFLPIDLDRKKFSRSQDSLLKRVSITFSKNGLKIGKNDKKASFINITVKDQSELFSLWMNRYLVEEATNFYLDLKVGKMKRSVSILQNRVDSVQRILYGTMISAASGIDQSMGLVSNVTRVGAEKKLIQSEILIELVGELTKNLEITKFTLEREEPIIQIIDVPTLPLEKFGKGRVESSVIGGFLFGFISLGFLFLRKKLNEL